MSNNGFTGQYSSTCVPVDEYARQYCASTGGFSNYAGTTFWLSNGYEAWCYTPSAGGTARYSRIGYPNCQISLDSSVPTVSDGISLGWQAGSSLILVAVVLFLRKALIK